MSGRILVVDDETGSRTLVVKLLQSAGYQVSEAANGADALDMIEAAPPDLVFLDLEMPLLDGYGALRAIKSNPVTRLIPVVMLTSHDEFAEKLRAVEIGADDYLPKPFNHVELLARARSLVSLKQFTDELERASHVLEGVALCVESRDRYTGDHCKRLGEYAVRVGRALELGDEDLETLRLGGIFHDLGKIAVSDGILNKPGKLTPEEFEAIRTHAAVGSDLCRGMKTMQKVIPLIRHPPHAALVQGRDAGGAEPGNPARRGGAGLVGRARGEGAGGMCARALSPHGTRS